ncbi:MAG: hypothetical protein WBA57_00925 [Elainellaceae cyanobacterium]
MMITLTTAPKNLKVSRLIINLGDRLQYSANGLNVSSTTPKYTTLVFAFDG